jgi:hypothetical protein
MSVEVIAGSNNEWNFFEPEPTPSHDDTPLAEPPSPVERRTLLAERLRRLSQELSDTQDHYDQCVQRRREAMALGQPFSEIEFQTVTADLNRLIPERLACMVAIEEANDAIRNQGGIDTYGLAAHLARIAYQNPALTNQEEDSLFDSTPSLAQLLTLE